MNYQVPVGVFESDLVVKKSRFIARVVPVCSREDVNIAVSAARADYPDARHHCWAYLLGRPADAMTAGMSDDGEPAGTAGRPILNVLQHGVIGDVLVVVTRYFGGIKLGAGGLVRAYGGAAQQALEQAPRALCRAMTPCSIKADFSAEQNLRYELAALEADVLGVTYGEGVELAVSLPAEQLLSLKTLCGARGYLLSTGTREAG